MRAAQGWPWHTAAAAVEADAAARAASPLGCVQAEAAQEEPATAAVVPETEEQPLGELDAVRAEEPLPPQRLTRATARLLLQMRASGGEAAKAATAQGQQAEAAAQQV